MNNKNNDLLDPSELGTSKRASTPKKQVERPDFNSLVRRVARWIAGKVLPTVFLTVLAGFATKGVQIYLPEMSGTTQTVASIAVVAVMVVMVLAGDKDKV